MNTEDVFVFVDDWKDSEDSSPESPIAYFGRPFTLKEFRRAFRQLDNIWARNWHVSGSENRGMFTSDRPIWLKVSKQIVTSLSLPAVYSVYSKSSFEDPATVQAYKSFAYPNCVPQKNTPIAEMSEFPLGRMLSATPAGISFYEFCKSITLVYAKWFFGRPGVNSGIDKIKIHIVADQMDFFTNPGKKYLGRDKEAVICGSEQLEVTLRFVDKNSPCYGPVFLGLVDSECYALRMLHFKILSYSQATGRSATEMSSVDVEEICSAISSPSVRMYTKHLLEEFVDDRIVPGSWGHDFYHKFIVQFGKDSDENSSSSDFSRQSGETPNRGVTKAASRMLSVAPECRPLS